MNGDEISTPTDRGEGLAGDSFLVIANTSSDRVLFTLPSRRFGTRWDLALSTSEPDADYGRSYPARTAISVEPHSLMVLRRT